MSRPFDLGVYFDGVASKLTCLLLYGILTYAITALNRRALGNFRPSVSTPYTQN